MMTVATLRPLCLGVWTANGVTVIDAEAKPVCNWSPALLDGEVEPVYLDDEFYADDGPVKFSPVGELPF